MEVQCSVNGTSVCVPPGKVCDGVTDCANGKDETLCYRLAASQEEQPVGEGHSHVDRDTHSLRGAFYD